MRLYHLAISPSLLLLPRLRVSVQRVVSGPDELRIAVRRPTRPIRCVILENVLSRSEGSFARFSSFDIFQVFLLLRR